MGWGVAWGSGVGVGGVRDGRAGGVEWLWGGGGGGGELTLKKPLQPSQVRTP